MGDYHLKSADEADISKTHFENACQDYIVPEEKRVYAGGRCFCYFDADRKFFDNVFSFLIFKDPILTYNLQLLYSSINIKFRRMKPVNSSKNM